MSLTNDQYKLLDNLYKIGPRRTNILAKSLGWDNQHTPHVGLQLREQQLVSSTNDGHEYNKWDITATGRAKYLEETALRKPKKAVKEAPVTVPANVSYVVAQKGSANILYNRDFPSEEVALQHAKTTAQSTGHSVEVRRVEVVAVIRHVPATIEVSKP